MILCCGEALIDMLPVQGTDDGICYRPHGGGAAFNTAIALGRLGVEVALVSGVSSDQFGRLLQQALYESHVACDLLVKTTRPTTLAFVDLQDGQASYRFWDHGSALRQIKPQDFCAVPAEANLLLFGGISLCNAPIGDSLVALARQMSDEKLVMLDLNIRAGFAEDEAEYRTRLAEMMALADIIKCSEEDLDLLFTGEQTYTQKLLALRDQCDALLLFTRGADGAVALTGDGRQVAVCAPTVAMVDTVGAGDSFNAGFLAAAIRQKNLTRSALTSYKSNDLRAALKRAVQVASLSVSRAGANPPWQYEIPADGAIDPDRCEN